MFISLLLIFDYQVFWYVIVLFFCGQCAVYEDMNLWLYFSSFLSLFVDVQFIKFDLQCLKEKKKEKEKNLPQNQTNLHKYPLSKNCQKWDELLIDQIILKYM